MNIATKWLAGLMGPAHAAALEAATTAVAAAQASITALTTSVATSLAGKSGISGGNAWSGPQRQTPVLLTAVGGVVTVDFNAGNNFHLPLIAGVTMAAPINVPATGGQHMTIEIVQPGGGGCGVTWAGAWNFGGLPSAVNTAGSKVTLAHAYVMHDGRVAASVRGGY